MIDSGEVLIYQNEDGSSALEVKLERETVWLSLAQIANLFDRDKSVISRHLKKIFTTNELDRNSVVAINATTVSDGKTYQVEYYNLDAILSVGYRVNSVRGTQFRIWASNILKQHLIKGFSINEKRFHEQAEKLADLRRTVTLLEKTLANQPIGFEEARGLLRVIADYAYALTTLDRYDHGTLAVEDTTKPSAYVLSYETAKKIADSMKAEFGGLFGVEKDDSFKSALQTIYQTFGGDELYPSVEEKAAHLLYFTVKNHAFVDGNKRIAAAVFIYFLAANEILYRPDGSKRLADNALVALTLLIAESRPDEKDTIVKVIINLINRRND